MANKRRSLFVNIAVILAACTQFAATPCDEIARKIRLMERASPAASFVENNPAQPRPQRQFTEAEYQENFSANLRGTAFDGKPIELRLVSPEEMSSTFMKFSGKGFWLLFNPSGLEQRARFGHTTVIVNDKVFNRLGDGLGAEAMRSIPVQEMVAAMANSNDVPFVAAQFFELSPQSVQVLDRFFNDRVYLYHNDRANNAATPYATRYSELPFTRDRTDPLGQTENCAVFSTSFMLPSWVKLRPELAPVLAEIGKFRGSQLPNQQTSINSDSQSFRGLILMAKDKAAIREGLLLDGLQTHPYGENFAFTSPFAPIEAPNR